MRKRESCCPLITSSGTPDIKRVAHVEHAVGQARIGVQADDGRLARDERIAGGNPDRAGFVQGQDVGGLRCRDGCEEGRFRCPGIAEYERNFVRLKEVLNEFAASPTCHASLVQNSSVVAEPLALRGAADPQIERIAGSNSSSCDTRFRGIEAPNIVLGRKRPVKAPV